MDLIATIKTRRSIRQYKSEPPSNKDIEKILEAGRWAPSGLNNQPWRFMVIHSRRHLDGLAELTHYGKIIRQAPVAIAVFLDLEEVYNRDKDLMAIGACIQNMLLAAHALGLGTCWLGEILNRKKEVREYLRLPRNVELTALITLGYPRKGVIKSSRHPLKNLILKGISYA